MAKINVLVQVQKDASETYIAAFEDAKSAEAYMKNVIRKKDVQWKAVHQNQERVVWVAFKGGSAEQYGQFKILFDELN